MKERLILTIYRILLPLLFLVAFPGWVLKMLRRGGFGTALNERIGIYFTEGEYEPCGAVHLHAVSVGETMLALKLMREWQVRDPGARFVLATGTSTGHEAATAAKIPGLRVTYSPLDFPWMVRSYLSRFEPSSIVLIEGEIWPILLLAAQRRGIPVSLANARTSPRSAKRFRKLAPLLRPFFSRLSAVCIQEEEHRVLWQALGIAPKNIHLTGSIKFDPQSSPAPSPDPVFAKILASFGTGRPIVLAASTFPGEETLIAAAALSASENALPVIVPRHAERRAEVATALTRAGFSVTLRSTWNDGFQPTPSEFPQALVIDSTGELATWMNHADLVIMGKSFLSTGGQNPAEAILARKPLILGPHMDNFQPLVRRVIEAGGALTADDSPSITSAIRKALDPEIAAALVKNATGVLSLHEGSTQRHLRVLHPMPGHA
jgi:3-deoxy-D-manno-octulosonic-acid transferase